MGIKITTEWFDVEEDGLPDENTSVLFIHEGIVYEGWPLSDDYYKSVGEEIPYDFDRDWEVDGDVNDKTYIGVTYWAYKPEELDGLF